tara:strand:- start:23 stop:427 length:405 start_codon:yes stop_codon:yes gene_type:complete
MENSIYKKLYKVQKEIGAISKDSTNPFYNSKYFDINSLIKQLMPILEKHNLLLLQPMSEGNQYSKIVDVDTGDSVESFLSLPINLDAQKIGSAITYYRRYTLQSLLGLQAEDDDGNNASIPSKKTTNLNDERPF